MDDLNPIDEAATEVAALPEQTTSRRRRSFALRTGATAVVACSLAAGSYGIAAASSDSGTPRATNALAATSSKPSSPKPSSPSAKAPRLGGPSGFGRLGEGAGPLGFGSFGPGRTIKSVTATTITVETPLRGTVTVATNSSTTYSEGGKTVNRSALVAGDEVVFAPAGRPSSSTSSSTPVSSVEIVLPHVSGKVVSVAGTEVVVEQQGGLYVKVNLSASTSYDEAGQAEASSVVVAGAEVSVTGTLSSDHFQIDATTVEVLLASVSGKVTAVSGTTITIASFDGTTETVTTGSGTLFRNKSGKTTITSVAKGDVVEAFGTPGSGNSFSAVTVDVAPSPSPRPGGSGSFGRGRFGGPRGDNGPMGGVGGAAPWGNQGGGATTGSGASGVATTL
jgi:hypothetical protein